MNFPSKKLWPLILGASLITSSAWGADPRSSASDAAEAPPTLEQARAAFLEGRDLMKTEEWEAAAAKFAYAARAKNTPGLRYHVGLCLEKDGQLKAALRQYYEAEELLETERAADVQALVKEAIPRVEQDMPRLILKGIPHGAFLNIDERAESIFDDHYFVDPGTHEIVVRAPGFENYRAEVAVKRGETSIHEVQLSLPPEATADPLASSASHEEAPPNVPRRVVLWSSVSVGVIGLGVGITGTVLYARHKSDVEYYGDIVDEISSGSNSACAMPEGTLGAVCAELNKSLSRQATAKGVMIGGYVATAAGALGATLTYFLWPESSQEVAGIELKNLRPTAAITPQGDWHLGVAAEF